MPDGDPTPEPNPAPEARTFTQDELDRIVQDRLARDRQARKAEVPSDYAELKAKAEKFDAVEAEKLSELEKEQKARQEAEDRAAKREALANKKLIEAAVLAEATKAKAVKPEHMHKLIDSSSVAVGDDGQVTGVQEAVTAFLDANPEYVGKARVADPVDQGARGAAPGQITRDELKSMSSEEIVKAQSEGRLNDLLGIK